VIPVNEPLLGGRELEYVTDCVRTGWISSSGGFIRRFEEGWSRYCGREYGVAVTNGTAALQLAVSALDLKPGAEIIMPSFTIISCALAAIYNGATPVLVDVDPETWCMDPQEVEDRITSRTAAIMPVHMYGHPVEMDPLVDLAERRGLHIIEDAAQAHGAEYLSRRGERPEWRRCGNFGSVSCFSFFANKPITTGEGGMVLTDDAATAARLQRRRNLSFGVGRRFHHEELGHNFRLTNMQAALGLAQVERMAEIVDRKRSIGAMYAQQLAGLQGVRLPVEREWARSIYWMFGLVLADESALDAETVARALAREGVDTRPFFLGMHEQPALQTLGLFRGECHPVTERLARRGFYLPSGLSLSTEQQAHVIHAVREALA
jgi:perosamine synthetase